VVVGGKIEEELDRFGTKKCVYVTFYTDQKASYYVFKRSTDESKNLSLHRGPRLF